MLTMTFSDGTKATVFSGDMIMGGVRNLVETYTNGGSLFANITPNNHLMSYHDRRGKARARLHHRESRPEDRLAISSASKRNGRAATCRRSRISWNASRTSASRSPVSALAYETIKVNYAGYWAADEGRRVKL